MPNSEIERTADAVFEAFGGALRVLADAFAEVSHGTHENMRSLAECYGIEIDGLTYEEIRQEIRRQLGIGLLRGTPAYWKCYKQVAHLICHRDGSYTAFLQSFPRLSRAEIRDVYQDLKWGLPEGVKFRVKAIWKKERRHEHH